MNERGPSHRVTTERDRIDTLGIYMVLLNRSDDVGGTVCQNSFRKRFERGRGMDENEPRRSEATRCPTYSTYELN